MSLIQHNTYKDSRQDVATVLAISSEPPWPLDSGGHLRTFNFLDSLATHFNVHLICPLSSGKSSSVQLPIDSACSIECVTVSDRSVLSETKKIVRAQLYQEPYTMYGRHKWPPLLTRWKQAIEDYQPEFIWLDHIDSFQYYLPAMKGRKCILDMHNIYSLILFRLADECKNPLKSLAIRTEARRLEKMERRACREVDVVIAVSDQEAAHFKHLGAKRIWMAPNGVSVSNNFFTPPPQRMINQQEAPIILFLGAMNWQPNISAAQYLAKTIFPKIKDRFPQIELKLVGKEPVTSVKELSRIPGVTVTGTVPDIQPYLSEASLMVVPLESGGGTRLKILEAFAARLPVVSTPVGVEGIDAEDGKHLHIVELDDMPDTIIKLLGSLSADEMTSNALQLVKEKYDWPAIANQTAQYLQALP